MIWWYRNLRNSMTNVLTKMSDFEGDVRPRSPVNLVRWDAGHWTWWDAWTCWQSPEGQGGQALPAIRTSGQVVTSPGAVCSMTRFTATSTSKRAQKYLNMMKNDGYMLQHVFICSTAIRMFCEETGSNVCNTAFQRNDCAQTTPVKGKMQQSKPAWN